MRTKSRLRHMVTAGAVTTYPFCGLVKMCMLYWSRTYVQFWLVVDVICLYLILFIYLSYPWWADMFLIYVHFFHHFHIFFDCFNVFAIILIRCFWWFWLNIRVLDLNHWICCRVLDIFFTPVVPGVSCTVPGIQHWAGFGPQQSQRHAKSGKTKNQQSRSCRFQQLCWTILNNRRCWF